MIQTTKVYKEITNALDNGYNVISEQGGARSSKTYNTVLFLIVYLLEHPNTLLSIVRATLPAIKGSVYRDFEDILQRMKLWNVRAYNKSEMIYSFANGSEVEFFSTDQEQKLRGRKRNILFVNEANELSFMEWKQLKMRTTQFCILDYNPSFSDEHWLNELNKEEKTYHFVTTYRDNPFLERTIIDEIESYKRSNASLWRVYGEGLQAVIEGAVYPEFEIVDDVPPSKRRWVGMDLGFTNDPTAIVEVTEWQDDNGKYLYLDEIAYQTGLVTGDIIHILKQFAADKKIICESADPRMIEEIHRAGLNIHPVRKYAGSIQAGISKTLEYRLRVTKRSRNIAKELKNYTYMQDKNGKWLNQPIDCFNHACDAFRYVVMEQIMGGVRQPIDRARLSRIVH